MIAPNKANKKVETTSKTRSLWFIVCTSITLLGIVIAICIIPRKQEVVEAQVKGNKTVNPPTKVPLIDKPLPATTKTVEEEDPNSLEWHKKYDKRYFVPPDAVRRPNGRLYTKEGRRILEKLPARILRADEGRKPIFEHQAERDIARLLSMKPGEFFLGDANYGPRFQQSFAAAVASPTPILKEDDDATRILKEQVNEVKEELKNRLKVGEDIVQIMKDTEQELRALSNFRQDMIKNLTVLRFDESVTEQDYADYIDAANKMLEERGLKRLTMPAFAEGQLKYIREVHKAKTATNAAEGSISSKE